MSRTQCRTPDRERVLAPVRRLCPAYSRAMRIRYENRRTLVTLAGTVRLELKIRRCEAEGCTRFHNPYRPEAKGALALPQQEFGLDVMALVGALRHREHRSVPEIHAILHGRGVAIAERSVTTLLDRYDEVVATQLGDPAHLRRHLAGQDRIILALDGLQPDVGHEVLWVLRDCLSGTVVLARSLLSGTAEDLAVLLHEAIEAVGLPVAGVISDGQQSIRKAVAVVLPGVPHQLCHFHFLREAALPIFEADRHAKKELKKGVRGVRPIERAVEGRTDGEADLVRGYASAVRSAIIDDGRAPLDAAGLRLKGRLEKVAGSLERMRSKGGASRPLARLQHLIERALAGTAALWPAVEQGAAGFRLDGVPGSREIILSYAAAERSLKARLSGDTFRGLIREFTTSPEFTSKLSAGTQREYTRMLGNAEPEFGDMPREALNDPGVRQDLLGWRTKVVRASGEREADNRLSVISAMLTWAQENGRLSVNHLRAFRRLYHVDRSEIVWLPEHVAAFMAVAPLELQQALIMALHSGQRQGDLLRPPWSAYDGEVIVLRQGKSARNGRLAPLVTIPCTRALRRMLDGMPRRGALILGTRTGKPLLKRYFSRLWDQAMQAAGLGQIMLPGLATPVHLHFHDLRGTAVTMLSEAGCSPQQIAAITGHSLKTVTVILERYLARTRALAD